MPKALYSSRDLPDSFADRLAAHRFGVFACTVFAVFASCLIGHVGSVRDAELAATRVALGRFDSSDPNAPGGATATGSRMATAGGARAAGSDSTAADRAAARALPEGSPRLTGFVIAQ